MALWALVLFLIPFLAGGLMFRFSSFSRKFSNDVLTFGGAFLFTITLIHLLPEVFAQSSDFHQSGLWMFVGFGIQIVVELLFGSEHDHGTDKSLKINTLPFLLAVFFHAFTEGGMLILSEGSHYVHEHQAHNHHNHHHHDHHHNGSAILFLGILFHKIPTAITVVSIFLVKYSKKLYALFALILMVSATPLGMFSQDLLVKNQLFSPEFGQILSALVVGSFLHVASVLFFNSMHGETTKKYRKPLLIAVGAGIGIASELFF